MNAVLIGMRSFLRNMHPVKLVFLGYISYIVTGWLLLCLPFTMYTGVSTLDNLFIATSAVSTTGLATTSVSGSYTFAGQFLIMALIQLGGIGYMTFSSFVILAQKKTLSGKRSEISEAVFSLPKTFVVEKFIRSVIIFTFVIELAGAAALYPIFRTAGVETPLWSAIFHSVSSFCTAGFGLYDNSFECFTDNFWLNFIVAVLSYLGAVGFIVCVDVYRRLTAKTDCMTLTSRIILWTTFWMTVTGTAVIFLSETSISAMPPYERLMAAFFQAMSAMTTVGFNSVGIGALSQATLMLLTILMVIGASPSGTGGGLKTTTFSAFLGLMRSTIIGRKEVTFWGKPIPEERIQTAVASLGFYLACLLIGAFILTLTEPQAFEKILFEAASALGTVGLSTGITSSLTVLGKIIVILLMFVGRLGPLSFGMALTFRPNASERDSDNDLAV